MSQSHMYSRIHSSNLSIQRVAQKGDHGRSQSLSPSGLEAAGGSRHVHWQANTRFHGSQKEKVGRQQEMAIDEVGMYSGVWSRHWC